VPSSIAGRHESATASGEYAPLGDYAAIGDGRTVALVARDGSVDWLCLPDLDSPSVFAAVLDAQRGGRFLLEPEIPAQVQRRYLPDTNVLETTFTTGQGAVRVIDALTLPGSELGPTRELVRRVECVRGRVPMRWRIAPAFGYGAVPAAIERRGSIPVAVTGREALAVCTWDAGEAQIDDEAIYGRFEAQAGTPALLALSAAHQEPLVIPTREQVEARLDGTGAYWRGWAAERAYSGPWRDAVIRSALALKLLVHAPSGAIAAAATASLPEEIGGERNWDYRFCWVRDSAFTLGALLELGCPSEAEAFFWWLLHASQLTHPRLQVLYRLNGGERARERTLELHGYRGSRPVRVGNDAAAQTQLDIYGDLLQTALVYTQAGGRLDRETGKRLAGNADLVCRIWREPDSGIWEVRRRPGHFTHSKMMCWVALDRALRLAEAGHLPRDHESTWRREREAIRDFIETRCWSDQLVSYTREAGREELDASLLQRRRRAARRRGRLPLLLFLARRRTRPDRAPRRGRSPDDRAGLARQRRRSLRRGDRPRHPRVSGQHPAGARASRADHSRGVDLERKGVMSIWGALAGGFIGTLVLTTALRTANELGLTRIDLPFLLGTAVTRDRARAKALGYLMHLTAGELFALVYYAIFAATETSGWALGALLGLLHGIVSATALVNILLPAVHPRMGNELTAANSSPLLEPPGFLLRNYGRGTPTATLLAHIAYGAIVGGFASIAG
jgi:GH15 family glucan-1,4-alpha-glucosidase